MNAIRSVSAQLLLSVALSVCLTSQTAAQAPPTAPVATESLTALVNRHLALPTGVTIPPAGDAEYLRRVSLDLIGMPPTADEARAFLADTDPSKREKLVDRLLASPQHTRHLAATLDVMLMERRANTHVPQDEWMAWLMASVQANKPWNVLLRELLTADGEPGAARAAARFLLDRGAEPNVVARDIGRLYFGRDMQCAQCHDSPLTTDFLQHDYQGLLAVSSAITTVVRKVDGKDVTLLADRAGSDLTFESVFAKGTPHRTGARLPGGTTLREPFLIPGQEYTLAPADGVRSVPISNRRQWLAETATSGQQRLFNENAVNRIWSLMFGRGLVQPLDMLHPDNPAASPELLQELGQQFAAAGFDIRSMLRALALSEPYQRPFDLPSAVVQQLHAAAELPTVAAVKVTVDAAAAEASSARDAVDTAFSTAETALIPVAAEYDKARAAATEARKKLVEAEQAAAAATAAFNQKKKLAETLAAAAAATASAAETLAGDEMLKAAGQTLTTRSAAVAAEFPALEKAAAEKTAAVAAPAEAMKTAVATLETAHQKTVPLAEIMFAEEAKATAARSGHSDLLLRQSSLTARMDAATRINALIAAQTTEQTAQQQVASRQATVVAANQSVHEGQAAVQTMETARQQAVAAQTAAAQADQVAVANAARAARIHSLLTEAAGSLTQAAAASAELVPGPLAESLQTRLTAAAGMSDSMAAARAETARTMAAADAAVVKADANLATARTELERRRVAVTAAETEVTVARQQFDQAVAATATAAEPIPADLATRFGLAPLKPLSPEQLCWTVFKVTTVYDRYVAAEEAELSKTVPLTEELKKDPAALAARASLLEQRAWDKLKGNLGSYVAMYGGAPGQPQTDFYASPDQALFTANGSAINSWVAPAGGNAAERIIKATDPRVAAEELYLGVLTRMPTEDEVNEVTAFLAARPDRSRAAQELVWGLLSSAEFRFNH